MCYVYTQIHINLKIHLINRYICSKQLSKPSPATQAQGAACLRDRSTNGAWEHLITLRDRCSASSRQWLHMFSTGGQQE